jgi:hypothetical protein
MAFSFAIERRNHEWYADVREVPGTGCLGPTRDAAIAGALRKFAEKAERRELSVDALLVSPHSAPLQFTGADLLALWKHLPHPDPGWADAVEEAVHNQPMTSSESPWDR